MLESLSTSGGNNISATSTNSSTTSGNSISSDIGNENTSATIGTSTTNATNSNTNTSVTVGTNTTSNSNVATNATDDVNNDINVNSTPAPTPTSSASSGGSNNSISTPATSTDNSGGSSTTAATNAGEGSSNVGTTAPTINSGNGSTGAGSTSSQITSSGSEDSNVTGDSSSLIVADSRSGSNAIVSSPTSSGSGVVIGITCGCIAVGLVACALVLFVYRRRDEENPADDSYMRPKTTATSGDLTMTKRMVCGQTELWTDDIITAKRISRSKVQVRNLISQGGYGQVYAGVFHGRSVAVKMLLPATRTDIKHVNNFLAEAKMAATMDHPRIVSLVGIAWDSLSDLCVVFEFMKGGDLRSLLDKYQQAGHPVGLNHQKATIAIHICHALTYLHSLSPSIIHRDLKSRNVLLNRELEAKLTDFGVSREKQDGTMTAGVGTSLWLAPEIMMGEHYDDKADIFSLGVLLSELDIHTLPYAREKQTMSDAVLLHRIVMGATRVSFSPYSPREFQDLGHACVSGNPRDRPTAAEVLYRLQVVLLKCLASSESDGLENSGISGSVLSYTI
ncbi:hypothetical protein PR003_g4004 [Phytophthora rubi]|uniref:Protein kinase domain-containing protein n=1 Tax=Phytophthora rubi TaxID=129364 RepID=A0A6A3P528_9STRA|nr:hypothetical protein PR001_g3964 [Phytophthora rubi]KAE9353169.1 hypothetical protein PR003_g4004 [Phytophthora rubi]